MKVIFEGLNEVLQNLAMLNVEEELENKALTKAGKIIQESIQKEAPIDKRHPPDRGSLHKNIKLSRPKDGEIKVHTGRAYHAHLVEFGRSGGSIMAKKNGKLQKITWGPTTPNPFFTRGFEKSKDKAKRVMAKEIKKVLEL